MGSGPGSGIGSGSRITVEVLDDTEQDATPRDNIEIEKEKKNNTAKTVRFNTIKRNAKFRIKL